MIDVGLFDPLIRFILRVVGNSPVRLVIGTAVLAGMVSLDGDGSTTFIITVSALLPIYLKLGMSPVVLTVVACLANGVLNIVPWGGPTVRAATVLKVSPNELFIPMVPGMIAGDGRPSLVLAYMMGRSEKKRLLASGAHPGIGRRVARRRARQRCGSRRSRGIGILPPRPGGSADAGTGLRGGQLRHGVAGSTRTARPCGPKLIWFNLALTVGLLVMLGLDMFPLALLFMIAAAIALVVNFPNHHDQSERIKAHASFDRRGRRHGLRRRRAGRACWRAPAWSPRWPTPSSPRCRRRSVPGSR